MSNDIPLGISVRWLTEEAERLINVTGAKDPSLTGIIGVHHCDAVYLCQFV